MAIQISGETVIDDSGSVNVGSASSLHIEGANSFVKNNAIGLGQTDTTGRDAGVGTATGTLVYNETTTQVEVYDGTNWVGGLTSPFSATGGTLDSSSRTGYNVHTFTSPGSLVVTSGTNTAEYLVIAGGAGGGAGGGGGGGAGGYLTGSTLSISPGTYTIQVGGGGASPAPLSPADQPGGAGTPSFITNPDISSITSVGGGGGGKGSPPGNSGDPGGSGGGGGGYETPSIPGGTGISSPVRQGYDGGIGAGVPGINWCAAGGGGGAGGVGGNGTPYLSSPRYAGSGGNGSSSSITGSPVTRGGGGGGGGIINGSPAIAGGTAGPGGGGTGAGDQFSGGWSSPTTITAGTSNTGGGGGGGGAVQSAATGGSGIVIIAYPTA